jgi:hypothetical protein
MIQTIEGVMLSYVTAVFSRDIDTLRHEIETYPDDAALWQEVPGLANAGGTLALHLAGNLQHFIGGRLGGSGYLRDRPAEFSRRGVSKKEILAELDRAGHVVRDTLGRLRESDLTKEFPDNLGELTAETGDFLIHLHAHLNYHIGQIDYHRRVVSKGAPIGVLPMAKLASARPKHEDASSTRSFDPVLSFDLDEGIAVLERTPSVLRALLAELPEPWITANEGPKTWSPFDVVGHLIDGEEHDWIARTRIILEEGPGRPFEPFNRFGHLTANRGKPFADLLDRFENLRRSNVETLRGFNLSRESCDRLGTHPDFGAVTLRQLLATWVVHDLGHIGQIVRTMAGRYRQDVGPWFVYLPVLHARKGS